MIFGDLPMIPFILVLTLQNRNTLFCVFLSFRGLNEVKLSWDFSRVNISSREASGALGPHETGSEAQKSTGGAPQEPGRATHALFAFDRPICWFFFAIIFVWPKNPYIKTPQGFPRGERRRNTETPKRRLYRQDWRGKLRRRRRWSDLILLQRLQHHHHDEEGVVHPWTMGLWQ